jgi:hypothetical protein
VHHGAFLGAVLGAFMALAPQLVPHGAFLGAVLGAFTALAPHLVPHGASLGAVLGAFSWHSAFRWHWHHTWCLTAHYLAPSLVPSVGTGTTLGASRRITWRRPWCLQSAQAPHLVPHGALLGAVLGAFSRHCAFSWHWHYTWCLTAHSLAPSLVPSVGTVPSVDTGTTLGALRRIPWRRPSLCLWQAHATVRSPACHKHKRESIRR